MMIMMMMMIKMITIFIIITIVIDIAPLVYMQKPNLTIVYMHKGILQISFSMAFSVGYVYLKSLSFTKDMLYLFCDNDNTIKYW